MSIWCDLSFEAKLTDFGYEIIQEIYKNRPSLPVLLGSTEDYDEEENNIYLIRSKTISDHIGKIEMANSYKKDTAILLNILDKLLKNKENFYTSNEIGIK